MEQLPLRSVTGADFYGVCSNAWLNAARQLIKSTDSDGNFFFFSFFQWLNILIYIYNNESYVLPFQESLKKTKV